MPIDILMPALSPSMEKGNLIQWLKAVGDKVRSGDILAEIETDKATMEVEAPIDGVLRSIVVPAGTTDVPVNRLIGSLAAEDEAAEPAAPASPILNGAHVEPPQAAPAVQQGSTATNHSDGGRIFASPIARRLMAEAGIAATSLAGSGPKGRILERDVTAAIAARETTAKTETPRQADAPGQTAANPSSSDYDKKALFDATSYVEVPHDQMRLTIARRLLEAKCTVPHFYLSADCAIDALLALRQQFNDAAPMSAEGVSAYRLSVNDFIIRALALALNQVPEANVSFTESALLRHTHADIGVAVAIPGGLMTPIVRHCETKTLATISNEVKELAGRAKLRRLKPQEYQGGTASVSNLGMYGVKDFAAIINPPQASILAVGGAEQRMIVRDGAPVVATVMSVTLSVDHRAVDGATGAQLLSAFKALVERPMAMLV